MTEPQYAALTISLSTLGQVALSDNDPEQLETLAYLLEAAAVNVRRALAPAWSTFVNAREEIEDEDGNTRPMTPDERRAWEQR
jgi:hypothetical protein